jgi:hypothetical protein
MECVSIGWYTSSIVGAFADAVPHPWRSDGGGDPARSTRCLLDTPWLRYAVGSVTTASLTAPVPPKTVIPPNPSRRGSRKSWVESSIAVGRVRISGLP